MIDAMTLDSSVDGTNRNMTPAEDNPNFFRRANDDEKYWEDYLAARPHYDESFYQSIYAYHRSNGGSMDVAHDVGTGPGQVAVELAAHFETVVASDNNATHLVVASRCLALSATPPRNVSLVECPGEALSDLYPVGSADLVVAAECLPLLDADKAMETFASLLRPKGTLAMWFYGRPVFAEPEYASACQPVLESILDATFVPLIKGGGPQRQSGWKRATNCMSSFLDDMKLDNRIWQHVERRKWNSQYPMPFYSPAAYDFDVTTVSQIGEEELVIETNDPTFWQREWDLRGVERFMQAIMPNVHGRTPNESIQQKYRELA